MTSTLQDKTQSEQRLILSIAINVPLALSTRNASAAVVETQ